MSSRGRSRRTWPGYGASSRCGGRSSRSSTSRRASDSRPLPASPAANREIIIVETETAHVGVIVDDVQEVLTLHEGDTEPLPVAGNAALDAIAKIGDRLVVIIEPRGLFGGGELELAA